MTPVKEIGKVQWFDAKKGYGFIGRQSGKDVFVHYTQLKIDGEFKKLLPGDEVEFEIMEKDNKAQAKNVTLRIPMRRKNEIQQRSQDNLVG
jgi:cold shock protein